MYDKEKFNLRLLFRLFSKSYFNRCGHGLHSLLVDKSVVDADKTHTNIDLYKILGQVYSI